MSAVLLQGKEHLAQPLLPEIMPQLDITKIKPPTLKIKQRRRRTAKHLLPKDKFISNSMRRNPYYDPYHQTSVFPPRENTGLKGYKLISTQLISLFNTSFHPSPLKRMIEIQ